VPRLWRKDFTYTPPVNALQTWTLNGTVAAGTQGVVWINGHCLGRQITSQPALFVPECWLQANNTILLVTQGGGAPQGYSLAPVEYHSFASSPTGLSPRANALAPLSGETSATVVAAGNRISLPPGFAGKAGNLSIYDLQGHVVVRNVVIHNGIPVVPNGMTIPNGVFIARSEK
jgi:hypothetical protein